MNDRCDGCGSNTSLCRIHCEPESESEPWRAARSCQRCLGSLNMVIWATERKWDGLPNATPFADLPISPLSGGPVDDHHDLFAIFIHCRDLMMESLPAGHKVGLVQHDNGPPHRLFLKDRKGESLCSVSIVGDRLMIYLINEPIGIEQRRFVDLCDPEFDEAFKSALLKAISDRAEETWLDPLIGRHK